MADFESAFKKPFSDWKKLLIGCLLNIVPIVNLLAVGYHVQVARATMAKRKDLPDWTDWGNLFVNGLLALLIGLLYAVPLVIAAFVVMGAHFVSLMMTGNFGSWGMGMLLVALLLLLTTLAVPSAVMNFVVTEKFGAAFQLNTVFRKAFTKEFLLAWAVSLLYMLLFGFILGMIPMVGPAISGFIVGITSFTLFAENYKKL